VPLIICNKISLGLTYLIVLKIDFDTLFDLNVTYFSHHDGRRNDGQGATSRRFDTKCLNFLSLQECAYLKIFVLMMRVKKVMHTKLLLLKKESS